MNRFENPGELNIMYSPSVGVPVADGEIEQWWDRAKKNNFEQVGQELLVLRARVGLLEGDIDELVVSYQGRDFEVSNTNGAIMGDFWSMKPSPDPFSHYLGRLLDGEKI